MSEVQSRPSAPRGRGSARSGRAGFSNRGGRGGRVQASTSPDNASTPAIEEDSEIAQMKKQYGGKVTMIQDMYPSWTDADVVYALNECDGDLELTVERITDGTITQWGEVSKPKKDRSKSKAPETNTTTFSNSTNVPRVQRGAFDNTRGGRGRGGSDRGRGRGGRGGPIAPSTGNQTKPASAPLSVPTTDAWGSPAQKENALAPTNDSGSAGDVASTVTETVKAAVSSIIPDGSKTWASIFKPAPAPAPRKDPAPVEKAPEPVPEVAAEPEKVESPPAAEPAKIEAVPEPEEEAKIEEPVVAEAPAPVPEVIEPSRHELTETNLEQILDTSGPIISATAASTAASSWDPRSGATSATPFSALQSQSARPGPPSGFATSAQKAAGGAPRASSFQRRVLDQEEAVRMPGNRDVDRTAVQFGAFSLGSSGEEDVDADREETETRAQPEHSPVSAPRASLPQAPQAVAVQEGVPQPKEQPQGLPSAPIAAPGLPSPLPGAQSMSQQGSQGSHQYSQYGRYGQSAEQSAFGQKPYDPFSQQAPSAPSQYDGYPTQQSQTSQAGASSAPSEYSQYYTADQQRHAYQNYYGGQYGQQQTGQAHQEAPTAQRSFSGYNAPAAESSSPFPQSTTQTTQSRYATAGETQTSGHSTPNPPTQSQQATTQSSQGQQSHPTQPQGQQPGGGQQYPYGNPYYSSPYYTAYMNNYNQGYGQGNYGAGPYGKGGMYNQPHAYGMSPQTPYDHTPSPAAGAFGGSSLHGRDSAVGAGLSEYGRGASQQSGAAAQPIGGSTGFNSMDSFGRGSSYQGQSQQYGQGSQQGAADDLKPFGDAKASNGPSPSLTQAARPGSAANAAPGQSALPPPQSAQQSYGGYPSHVQQQHALHGSQSGSQYGGLGGLGGQHSAGQGHQSSQYGSYGQGGFGGNQYGGYGQQRGGWGNNYQH